MEVRVNQERVKFYISEFLLISACIYGIVSTKVHSEFKVGVVPINSMQNLPKKAFVFSLAILSMI